MFEAIVIVCIHAQLSWTTCSTVVDTRGPYKTHQECKARTDEMTTDIRNEMYPNIPMAWRCEKPIYHIKEKKGISL